MTTELGPCPMGCGNQKDTPYGTCNPCKTKYTKEEISIVLKAETIKFLKEYRNDEERIKNDTEKQFIEELLTTEGYDDKEKILKLLNHKYKFYCDSENPNLPVYVWNGKIWDPNIEKIVLKEIFNIFGDRKIKVQLKEVMENLKGGGQYTEVKPKPPHLIVLNNGMFDLDEKKLIPFDSKYFYVNMIPHNYNPEIQCPNWIDFQKDIHNEDDLEFIQEWFGYSLYTSYPTKSFLICVGSGDNGKSIELSVIKEVIGRKNNTSVTLQHINDSPYGVAELYHKLINISDDISNQRINSTGSLKTVSDGGEITARRIYGAPFDMIPYAKITNSCNEPPEIRDDTDAIWNRLKAVFYNYKFVEMPVEEYEKQKLDREELLASLEQEYEGIINWLIEGLIRLRENKFKFSYNLGTKEVRKIYRTKSQPITSWIEQELIYTGDPENFVLKEDIYTYFEEWIEKKGIKNVPGRNRFFQEMKSSDILDTRNQDHDFRRVYIGYKVRCQDVN